MGVQMILQVGGRHRLAAAVDDVLDSSGDFDIPGSRAVVEDPHPVAGAVEAVGREGPRVGIVGAVVPVECVGPPHQQFAFLPGSHLVTVVVDDAHLVSG